MLDDFQEVGTGDVLADVESLLEQPHPSLRLVLATRSDPPVRLQRLRLAGDMVEIRAADLAFTADETSELLRPLELAPADVETLWSRTEGWVAALRLAELSLQAHPDPSAFIAGFAGDDRAVSDYLTSEVLNGYDEDKLRFLLRTSIVERVNAELVEALTGTSDGRTRPRRARAGGRVRRPARLDGRVVPLPPPAGGGAPRRAPAPFPGGAARPAQRGGPLVRRERPAARGRAPRGGGARTGSSRPT